MPPTPNATSDKEYTKNGFLPKRSTRTAAGKFPTTLDAANAETYVTRR